MSSRKISLIRLGEILLLTRTNFRGITWADGVYGALPENLHALLLQQLGATLARLHQARWQHGCLYPKHVFARVVGQGADAQVEIALLDLEKSRRRLNRKRAAAHDLKQLRRHSSWSEADWDALRYGYDSALH